MGGGGGGGGNCLLCVLNKGDLSCCIHGTYEIRGYETSETKLTASLKEQGQYTGIHSGHKTTCNENCKEK